MSHDLLSLSPLLFLLFGALTLLLSETFIPKWTQRFGAFFSLAVIVAALISTGFHRESQNPLLTRWITFDAAQNAFTQLFLCVGLASVLLSHAFFQTFNASAGEYYFLLLSVIFGLILIGSSADFLTLFIGLETLSIGLYVLVGYIKRWNLSHESAIKYFFTGALGAAFLLYGIALIYGAVGTTQFDRLLPQHQQLPQGTFTLLFLSGAAFVTVGFAFKAALVPLHAWAPDVYDGAPTPVTAFMAVGTKMGAFAAFARVFLITLPHFDLRWNEAMSYVAYATLIYANYVAMRQVQLRRFFAYSGISHAGFLLIPLIAATPDALQALLFYLAVYALATLGCFAVLAFLDQKSQGVTLNDLRGLFSRSPFAAILLALCLLTLAGIPPTIGFFAKFFLLKIAFQAGYYALVLVALLTTILSAYYYLRLIGLLFTPVTEEKPSPTLYWPAALLGCLVLVALTAFSFYPQPLSQLLNKIY